MIRELLTRFLFLQTEQWHLRHDQSYKFVLCLSSVLYLWMQDSIRTEEQMFCKQKPQISFTLNKLQGHLITSMFVFSFLLCKGTSMKMVKVTELLVQGTAIWNTFFFFLAFNYFLKCSYETLFYLKLSLWTVYQLTALTWILLEYWHLALEECICLAHIFLCFLCGLGVSWMGVRVISCPGS